MREKRAGLRHIAAARGSSPLRTTDEVRGHSVQERRAYLPRAVQEAEAVQTIFGDIVSSCAQVTWAVRFFALDHADHVEALASEWHSSPTWQHGETGASLANGIRNTAIIAAERSR